MRSSNPAGSHTSAHLSQCKVSVIVRLSGRVKRTGRCVGESGVSDAAGLERTK